MSRPGLLWSRTALLAVAPLALAALTLTALPASSMAAPAAASPLHESAPAPAQPSPAGAVQAASSSSGQRAIHDAADPASGHAAPSAIPAAPPAPAMPAAGTGQTDHNASSAAPAPTTPGQGTQHASPSPVAAATTPEDTLPPMRPEQRGLMIFQQVCSSCHSMERAHYGDMLTLEPSITSLQNWARQRHKTLESAIASPYPSVAVGKANNGGDYPPDLSHIARTIRGGPDYIRAMLAGYRPTPPGVTLAPHTYYNPVALTHHHKFKMRPPLQEGMMAFPDGTKATIPQMAGDVTAFLQWADDAHKRTRHFIGTAVLLYLAVLGAFLLGLWQVMKRES